MPLACAAITFDFKPAFSVHSIRRKRSADPPFYMEKTWIESRCPLESANVRDGNDAPLQFDKIVSAKTLQRSVHVDSSETGGVAQFLLC